jgi:hypothetical protein
MTLSHFSESFNQILKKWQFYDVIKSILALLANITVLPWKPTSSVSSKKIF